MPRDGVCADDVGLSVLKFFISCATRPRPAQVGAPPADPGSCGGVTGEESEAAASGKKHRKKKTSWDSCTSFNIGGAVWPIVTTGFYQGLIPATVVQFVCFTVVTDEGR